MSQNLTNLLLSGEGIYVSFQRELGTYDTGSYDFTETTSTLINSVLGDLQFINQPIADIAKGTTFDEYWLLFTNALSLVRLGDAVTVIGSTGIFEINGLNQWAADGNHWEFRLLVR